jgi:MFS family permease
MSRRSAPSAIRALAPPVRRVLIADFANSVGTGLVVAFLAVYVARVRGHGVVLGAGALACLAAGSLIANVVGGRAADRVGGGLVLRAGWMTAAAGDLVMLATGRVVPLLLAALTIGVGVGAALPALRSLLAALTSGSARSLTFGLQHGLLNAGLSLGTLGAALILAGGRTVGRFQLLYLLDAASFLLAAVLTIARTLPRHSEPAGDVGEGPAGSHPAGYRAVLTDRAFRRYALISGLLVVCGYAQFHAALPIFLSRTGGISPANIAIVFATNTLTVTALALPMALAVRSRRPTVLISGGALVFAASWGLLYASANLAGAAQVGLACCAAAVMGLAETLLAPALGPLLNDLAPAALRGRYNGADAALVSAGSVLAPLLTATLYTGGTSTGLFTVLVCGCVTAAVVGVASRRTLVRESGRFQATRSVPRGESPAVGHGTRRSGAANSGSRNSKESPTSLAGVSE